MRKKIIFVKLVFRIDRVWRENVEIHAPRLRVCSRNVVERLVCFAGKYKQRSSQPPSPKQQATHLLPSILATCTPSSPKPAVSRMPSEYCRSSSSIDSCGVHVHPHPYVDTFHGIDTTESKNRSAFPSRPGTNTPPAMEPQSGVAQTKYMYAKGERRQFHPALDSGRPIDVYPW